MQYPQKTEEGVDSPGTGVPDGRELPCGCWDLNLDPLQEKPVLVTAETSLQPLQLAIIFKVNYLPQFRFCIFYKLKASVFLIQLSLFKSNFTAIFLFYFFHFSFFYLFSFFETMSFSTPSWPEIYIASANLDL